MRPRRRSKHRTLWIDLSLAFVALGALSLLTWLMVVYPWSHSPLRPPREVEIEIGPGDTIDTIAHRLAQEKVLVHPLAFCAYARLLGAHNHLKRGRIQLRSDMSARTLLARLSEGMGPSPIDITIPEGFDRFEIAKRLERWDVVSAEAFLRATEDPQLLK
ncbi:MAG: endolytic transglycosylase MltG, partial [Sandaracinaceae bacterium]|nr:endolytic transglycosylase MltG [Sandaracinaceae bacterium]